MTHDWITELWELTQNHPDILADLPDMSWDEKWGAYLWLRRHYGKKQKTD